MSEKTIIIAVNSGVGLRVIDSGGRYAENIEDTKKFNDEIGSIRIYRICCACTVLLYRHRFCLYSGATVYRISDLIYE